MQFATFPKQISDFDGSLISVKHLVLFRVQFHSSSDTHSHPVKTSRVTQFTTNRYVVVLYIRYVAGNRWYLYYASPSSQFILTNVRSEYNYIYKIGEVCHSWAVRGNFMNETTPSKARKNGCGVSRPVKMSGLKRFAPRLVLVQAHVIDYCTFSTCFQTIRILLLVGVLP